VPFLVLTKKKDILQRIASARGIEANIQDICLQPPANLAAVISTLLLQPSSDVEGNATRCLAEVAPGFQSSDLGSLVRSNPVLIACEMLKTAGDEDASNASKVSTMSRMSFCKTLTRVCHRHNKPSRFLLCWSRGNQPIRSRARKPIVWSSDSLKRISWV
jgi:hypothetical protein